MYIYSKYTILGNAVYGYCLESSFIAHLGSIGALVSLCMAYLDGGGALLSLFIAHCDGIQALL